jgi:hypothetical protein
VYRVADFRLIPPHPLWNVSRPESFSNLPVPETPFQQKFCGGMATRKLASIDSMCLFRPMQAGWMDWLFFFGEITKNKSNHFRLNYGLLF